MFKSAVLAGMIGLGLVAVGGPSAHAYPENVRHGYTNCTSCHVNPNGAGILNPYGRQLSKAVQSYGKFFFEPARPAPEGPEAHDTEVEFLYGGLAHPDWLNFGGDLRFLQLFEDTPQLSQARFIVMQVDLEAAATVGRMTLAATVGRDDPEFKGVANPGFGDYFTSRRHYLMVQLTDEIHVMAGRFMKPFGIQDPNHISLVKRGLGWDVGTESYNLQAGYIGETYNLIAYGDFGRPGTPNIPPIEKGGGLTASRALGDRTKVGASYFYGTTDASNRHVVGPWGIVGISEHFYLRTEHDFYRDLPKTASGATSGYGEDTRIGYEFAQGVHGFVTQQFLQKDLSSDSSRRQVYGIGMLYYPRAHWEFEADFEQRKTGIGATSLGFTTYAYLLAHYYL